MIHFAFSCPVLTAWHSTEGNFSFQRGYTGVSLAGYLLWHSHPAQPQPYNICLTATDTWSLPFLAWKEKIFNIVPFPVESGDLEAQRKDQLHVTSQYSSRCSPVPESHQGSRAPAADQQKGFKAQHPPHVLSM